MSLNGKCHCGQVTWTVSNLDKPEHILCHCDACKVIGGGEYTLNLIAPISDVKVTKGELKKYSYKGDSGNEVHCFYCPNCTSHPFHHQTVQGDNYVVRSGLLSGAGKFPIHAEIYGKERYSFQPEIAKTFETTPPS